MSKSPAGMRSTSPTSITLLVVSGAQASMLPLVLASNKARCVIVPQLLPVAVGNSAAAALVAVVGFVPLTVNVVDTRA